MSPYKVHNTWVDLDTIISIGAWVADTYKRQGAFGHINGMFHSGTIEIELPLPYEVPDPPPNSFFVYSYDTKPASQIWEAFIEAWKNRATTPVKSQ